MRQQSRFASILTAGLLLAIMPVFQLIAQQLPEDIGAPGPPRAAATPTPQIKDSAKTRVPRPPYAPGSKPFFTSTDCPTTTSRSFSDHACRIVVYRDKPGSPQPVMLPKDTKVEIVVMNRPPLENVTFTQVTDALPPADFGLALAKAFLPVLSGIVGHAALTDERAHEGQPSIKEQLKAAQTQLNVIADKLACFKSGRAFVNSPGEEPEPDGKPKIDPCGKALDDAGLDQLKDSLIANMAPDVLVPLPVTEIKIYDIRLANEYSACAKSTPGSEEDQVCTSSVVNDEQGTKPFDDALSKLQARQTAVLAARSALMSLPDAGNFYDFILPSPDHKATVSVSSKDVVSGTAVDVAKVIVSWRSTPLSVSTGILFSTLHNKTYGNTPVIVNGVPVLDSSGKVTTKVTESDTVPSIVTPLIFLNYEILPLSSSNGRFGVHLSAGMGSNLTAKTADYAAGVSFRYRDILVTPAVHIGRQNDLTNGVVVGQTLGSSPPALPQSMHFIPKLGFAITYRIPLP